MSQLRLQQRPELQGHDKNRTCHIGHIYPKTAVRYTSALTKRNEAIISKTPSGGRAVRTTATATAPVTERHTSPAPKKIVTTPARPSQTVLTFDHCKSNFILGHDLGSVLPEPTLPRKGSLQLTPLDHFFACFHFAVWSFVFPEGLDRDKAQTALSNVLALYPTLAGQTHRREGSNQVDLHWDLDVRGLELLTATSPCTAHQLLPAGPHASQDGTRLLPLIPSDQSVLDVGLPSPLEVLNDGAPVARALLCQLAPSKPGGKGGVLLSLAVQHVVMDGRSMRQVMLAWAEQCRALHGAHTPSGHTSRSGLLQPSFGGEGWEQLLDQAKDLGVSCEGLSPDSARHILLAPKPPYPAASSLAATPTTSHHSQPRVVQVKGTDTTKLVGQRVLSTPHHPFSPAVAFYFSPQHIAALKAHANMDLATYSYDGGSTSSSGGSVWEESGSEGVSFVSSNDVVSARMWQALNHLPSHTPGHPTRFIRVSDMRGRLDVGHGHGRDHGDSHTPQIRIGNWVFWAVSEPMPAGTAPLGHLAAELRRIVGTSASKQQGLASTAYLDWAEKQGLAEHVWLTHTSMFDPTNADTAATSWDVDRESFDFGMGGPAWMQRSAPDFIQNHVILMNDLLHISHGAAAASKAGKGKKAAAGLWAWVGLTEADYAAVLERGIEIVQ